MGFYASVSKKITPFLLAHFNKKLVLFISKSILINEYKKVKGCNSVSNDAVKFIL